MSAGKTQTIMIDYDGHQARLAYHAHELVSAVIEDATVRFEIDGHEKRLALFAADGHKLDGHAALRDAGVDPGDHLALHVKTLDIIYNGRGVEFEYRGGELISALLQQALATFGITTNVHLMSLFDTANHELAEGGTLRAADVKPGDTLVLRQSAVKGG